MSKKLILLCCIMFYLGAAAGMSMTPDHETYFRSRP